MNGHSNCIIICGTIEDAKEDYEFVLKLPDKYAAAAAAYGGGLLVMRTTLTPEEREVLLGVLGRIKMDPESAARCLIDELATGDTFGMSVMPE
ncbi:MAG TPA: hypothetical protein VNT76_24260 [Candidatus Binatus sp.]|nr:hypothetical protein [Candidatus Binatus sp.]